MHLANFNELKKIYAHIFLTTWILISNSALFFSQFPFKFDDVKQSGQKVS